MSVPKFKLKDIKLLPFGGLLALFILVMLPFNKDLQNIFKDFFKGWIKERNEAKVKP